MLEVVPTLRSPSKKAAAAEHHAVGGFTSDFMVVDDDDSLLMLDYIDFTSCVDVVPSFFDADGDILPDLEPVDPTELLLAEFEDDCHHQDGGDAVATETTRDDDVEEEQGQNKDKLHELEEESPPDNGDKKRLLEEEQEGQKKKEKGEQEVLLSAVTKEDDDSVAPAGSTSSDTKQSSSAEGQSNKTKPQSNKNSSHGSKKKVKVDWTPELHRKFVQAVEQLGIDKAVPSRILEIMGIQGLTRHNIASHLQAAARKWGSHAVTPCWVPPPHHFPAPVLAGTMMPPMYRPQTNKLAVASSLLPQLPQLHAHPSKESIDAAIGDVLVKPWLPLPLGLKPPSLDSVMSELHKQGIPNIPPPAPG